MSSAMCLRCLGRSINAVELLPTPNVLRTAPFSTTAAKAAGNPKPVRTGNVVGAKRMTPKMKNRKKITPTGKPPAPGERKAARKKVTLNNANALEVPGLPELSKKWSSQNLQAIQGTVAVFSEASVATLRAFEGFQHTQAWGLFRKPATLIREDTIKLARTLEKCAEGEVARWVVSGDRGSGKSVLQLQALAMASLKGWLVVHVPDAKELVNAHTAYAPETSSSGEVSYIQANFTANLLQNIVNANRPVLSKLRLRQQHTLPISVQENISLDRFIELGAQDAAVAWPIWRAFWKEMTIVNEAKKTTQSPAESSLTEKSESASTTAPKVDAALERPPILFTMDGVQHLMRLSAYLNPASQPIHAHSLAIVQQFCDMLSGARPLPNGGLIMAATTQSNVPSSPVFDHLLNVRVLQAQYETSKSKKPLPEWDPYEPYDNNVHNVMQDVHVQQLQPLSKPETRGIIEYYARSGLMRSAITQNLVNEAWTISGGGIIGQIEKASVKKF